MLWTSFLFDYLLKNISDDENIYRFGYYFIHFKIKSFLYKFLLCVPSTCNYHWLNHSFHSYEFSNLFCRLKTVQNGHWKIHENKSIWKLFFCKWIIHFLYCLLPVICWIYEIFYLRIAWFLKYYLQCKNVIRLIIYHQNPSILSHIIYLFSNKVALIEWLYTF